MRGAFARCAACNVRFSSTRADPNLRAAFDAPPSASSPRGSTGGLFGHASLRRPDDFAPLVQRTANRAQLLVARIEREHAVAESEEPAPALRRMVKLFDRLSDVLCGVIDLAELVRNVHPSSRWVEAADTAYNELCEFMNILNVNPMLHAALARALDRLGQRAPAELFAACTVAAQFVHDFEKSGIHLPPAHRERFVALSSRIISLGRRFQQPDERDEGPPVVLGAEDLRTLGASMRAQLGLGSREVALAPNSWQAQVVGAQHPDEAVRKRVYEAIHSPSSPLVGVLEDLLRTRGELAQLVGERSFADVALVDKMAKTPGASAIA